MVMNIHLLVNHLVDSCERYGPIWVFWCYPFERMLGHIKTFVHSTRAPEKSFLFGAQLVGMMPSLEVEQFEKLTQDEDNITPKKKQVYFVWLLFI